MTSRSPKNPVTAAELASALPDVLAAPHDNGPVLLLCTRPRPNARSFPQQVTMTRAGGIAGDFEMSRPWLELPEGGPDPRIQVSILPARVLDLVWRERDYIAHPGDNIVVDMTLTEANLPTGTRLQVGSAVLRISDVPNDGCAKWKVRCGRAAYDWITDPAHLPLRLRGLFCSIEQDGVVTLGDSIRRL